MENPQSAVHRTIMVVDVEAFGAKSRTNIHQLRVRNGLYTILRKAVADAGIPWQSCHHEDRGDGVFFLVHADVPKAFFVEALPRALVDGLREHNRDREAAERIRLRVALHAGEILFDEHGATSASINLTFRLLEARPLKAALAASSGCLAIVVSAWFFDEVVRNCAFGRPASYRPINVAVKEVDETAWMCLPDAPYDESRYDAADTALSLPLVMTRTLPRDTVSFTGRDDEVARLLTAAAETAGARVVAIHAIDGMAGIGKTAFAVHVAHLLAESFPDGQLFMRLHAHTAGQRPITTAEALASLLTALGVAAQHIPAETEDRAALWRDLLTNKRLLLILDDAVGHRQVEQLLPAAAGCLVVVTSRRRMAALDAAVSISLDILPPEQAAALFTRIAGGNGVTAQPEAVAAVVRLCGYLPLAISLLAGRLRHHPSWSVSDLAADLDMARDRLAELRAEDVAVAAAFELSYRDLPPIRQRFFRHLGLHLGTELDAAAAAALTGTSISEAHGHLDALYNDHLLDEPTRGRYRMHDLVRDYARRLAGQDPRDERDDAVARLLEYYQVNGAIANQHIAAESPRGSQQHPVAELTSGISTRRQAMAWMHTERANLFACADYAVMHDRYALAVRMSTAMATFLRAAGPWDQAIALHRSAAEGAARDGDRLGCADALKDMGDLLRLKSDYRDAVAAHTRALRIYRDLGRGLRESRVLNELGIVRRLTDDYASAMHAHTQALTISRDLGDRLGEAFARNHLGIVQLVIGDYPGAIEAHTQALHIYRDLDHRLGEVDALNELGVVRRVIGDYPGAFEAHTAALSTYRDLGGEGLSEAFALNELGVVRRLTEDYPGAVQVHTEALDIYRELGNRHGEADALDELSVVRRLIGDHAGAAQAHAQALDIYRVLGSRLGQAEALNNSGALHLHDGSPRHAFEMYQGALELARQIQAPLEEGRALEGMGQCASALGDFTAGVADLRRALAIYQRIGAADAGQAAAHLATIDRARSRDKF